MILSSSQCIHDHGSRALPEFLMLDFFFSGILAGLDNGDPSTKASSTPDSVEVTHVAAAHQCHRPIRRSLESFVCLVGQ